MTDAPFTFLPFGAILQTFNVGGVNIVLGFPTAEDYKTHNDPHFGETIGRFANRLKDAKLDALNGGQTYQLAANNGVNNLHGGNVGWGQKVWDGPTPVGVRKIPGVEGLEGGESVQFKIRSEDGDEGFPGTVEASCVYTAGTQKVDGHEVIVLGIEYEAELVGGADETVINMTNHSYFNLSGNATIEGTQVELETNKYLAVDDGGIPTAVTPAVFSKVQGKTPFVLGAEEPDIDDCFVTNEQPDSIPVDTRAEPLHKVVSASHPATNIHLEVWTTEPAFQFYTGKYVDIPAVASLPPRPKRAGFCVEPSRYVNAPNVEEWKKQAVLKKGEKYGARIVYRAWKA